MGILDNLAGISSEPKEQDPMTQAGAGSAPQPEAAASQEQGGSEDSFMEALRLLKSNLPKGFVSANFSEGKLMVNDDQGNFYMVGGVSSNIMWDVFAAHLTNIAENWQVTALERCNDLNVASDGHYAAYYDKANSAIFMHAAGSAMLVDSVALASSITSALIFMYRGQTLPF